MYRSVGGATAGTDPVPRGRRAQARQDQHAQRVRRHKLHVVFLGESDELVAMSDWAQDNGVWPTDHPASDAICIVVDREVLDGARTAVEDEVLRHARSLRLPCLLPDRAWSFLLDAITEHNPPGAGAERTDGVRIN